MSMVLAPLGIVGGQWGGHWGNQRPSTDSPPPSPEPSTGAGRSLAAYDASLRALQAGDLPSGLRRLTLSIGREGERYLVLQVEPRPPAEMEAVRQAYVANGRILQAVDSVLRIDALG